MMLMGLKTFAYLYLFDEGVYFRFVFDFGWNGFPLIFPLFFFTNVGGFGIIVLPEMSKGGTLFLQIH